MQCILMNCCRLEGEMCAACGQHLAPDDMRRWDGETFCDLTCAWDWATARQNRRMILAGTLVILP